MPFYIKKILTKEKFKLAIASLLIMFGLTGLAIGISALAGLGIMAGLFSIAAWLPIAITVIGAAIIVGALFFVGIQISRKYFSKPLGNGHGKAEAATEVLQQTSVNGFELQESEQHLLPILQRLQANDFTLTSIEIINQKIKDNGAKALGKALEKNTTLTSLNLRDTHIDDAGASALAQALEKNAALTSLNLSDNNIGNAGASAIAAALAKNTSLTWLNLSTNRIRKTGAQNLGKALAHNTTLTSLNLKGNLIFATGVSALGQALAHNTTLTSLDLTGNMISDTLSKQIIDLIQRNQQYLKALQTTACELLKIGRILLFKVMQADVQQEIPLPLEIREQIVRNVDKDELLTPEQQRLILNYAEGETPFVASKLSFFKATKCERLMKKPFRDNSQENEPALAMR